LRERSVEVEKLRDEVERLSEEVEVLRTVVEEGLKERQLVREQHSLDENARSQSDIEEVEEAKSESEGELEYTSRNPDVTEIPDRVVRMEDPPPERAVSVSSRSDSPSRSPSRPISRTSVHSRHRSEENMHREVRRDERSPSTRSAPVSPIPAQASGSRRSTTSRRIDASVKERPFPQIRGARMERLFFSVPEHDTKTCLICRCRRRSVGSAPRQPLWPRRSDGEGAAEEDEGFVEGPEEGQEKVLGKIMGELEGDFVHYKR
jgi:hypothetical protein